MKTFKQMSRAERLELISVQYIHEKQLEFYCTTTNAWCDKSEDSGFSPDVAYRAKPSTLFGDLTPDEQKEILFQACVNHRQIDVYNSEGTFLARVSTVKYWAADQSYVIV